MLKSALLRVQPPAERNGELAQRPLDSRAAVADAVDDGHAADPREAYEELVHLFASRPRKKVRRTPSTAPQQERGRTGGEHKEPPAAAEQSQRPSGADGPVARTRSETAAAASPVPDIEAPCVPDRYAEHFDRVLTTDEIATLAGAGGASAPLVTDGSWQHSDIRKHAVITASPAARELGPLAAPQEIKAFGLRPRLQANCERVHGASRLPTKAAAATLALCRTYADVVHTCCPYATAVGALAPEEDAALVHVAQHILQKMDTVKRNNDRIAAGAVEASEVTDQGLVRPVVLILAPMRCVAHDALARLLPLLQRESRADSIQGKARLHDEFGPDEDALATVDEVARPAEHKALFHGTNTNDHFRFGIRVTRGTVKLFTDFYQSDIIVASPLGVATRLADGRDDGADFLSGIEVALVLRADVMQMQNWAHVEAVFEHLNGMPKQQHGTDIMRVRQSALNEQAAMYRQSILFASFASPEMNALSATWRNHSGVVTIAARSKGSLHKVVPQAKQLFRRVRAPSYADSHEARFHAFATHLWPRLKEADPSGLLIFASSYFEFVRLRGFLKQQGASLAVNCEYTDSSNVMRARARFRAGDRKVLLYTERAHFYFRPSLRGIKSIVFYSLPLHATYFAELVNMLEDTAAHGGTVEALFSEFDFLALSRVVGWSRAKRMLSDDAPSFLFT